MLSQTRHQNQIATSIQYLVIHHPSAPFKMYHAVWLHKTNCDHLKHSLALSTQHTSQLFAAVLVWGSKTKEAKLHMGGGGKGLYLSLGGGGRDQDLFYSQNKTRFSKNFTAHIKPRFLNVNSNRKTAFQYFTCVAMQGWELANQRNMPHIPAADVCLTTDRGVQHLLLSEPTQQVPVFTAGRRNPTPLHDWVALSGRKRPKERLCAWSTRQGRCRKFVLWLHVPTHTAVISPSYGTEKHLCLMHMHEQKERKKIKTLGHQIQK